MKSYRQWAKPVAYATERLISPNESNQRRGQKMLGAITNPEATYAIEYFLCSQAMPIAEIGIQKIYGFDGREATGSLLRVALYHNEAAARQTACEMLDKRNAAEFIPELIGMLESPVTSEYILTSVGAGQILHRHVFFQQRFDQDVVRQYDQMYVANLVNPTRAQPDPVAVNQLLANNLRTGRVGTERMEQAVLAHNLSVEQKNVRLIDVLRSVTSEDAGSTPEDWWNWWYDQNDIKMYQRPVSYRSESLGTTVTSGLAMRSGECFVAGTLVWTDRGLRAIEFLRTGDRVWAQDLKSKQMVYRNVITLTTREPSPTLLIQLPNEVLQVSDGHPFHVDGEGWMRARDLKRGTKLTGRQGVVSIENVSHGSVEPLFNLVVERDSNYFVGTAGVLSHDHTIPTSPVIIPAR
jgi:hypothetical protein